MGREYWRKSGARVFEIVSFIYSADQWGGVAAVLTKLYQLTWIWENHDFSIVFVTSHRVDVLQALLHF